MKKILFTFLVVAAMVSCTKDEGYTADIERAAATFTSSIDTRVSSDGTEWSAAENIGISMFTLSSDDTPIETLDSGSDNINYVSTNTEAAASVNFEAVTSSEEILYPDSGSVKFYAYYPYQAGAAEASYLYTANVSDQTANIDFMVAEPVTTTSTSATIGLVFSHKLAKLTISITGNDNVTDLDGVTTSISGLSTSGSYDIYTGAQSGVLLSDGSDIEFNMSYGTAVNNVITSATATAIILPETLASAATITFMLGTREFTISLDAGTAFAAGYNHSYTVALGNDYASFIGSTITGWGVTTETELLLSVPDPDIIFVEGDGDVDDVYQIITPLGLETFAALVNGSSKPAGAVISGEGFASFGVANTSINGVLTDDLDLEDICSASLEKSWTPIGSSGSPYSGTFDGAEYEVSNLYINTDTESYRHGLGLFGCISEATIKDLGVDGSVTYSNEEYSPYVGALVGAAYSSSITDCYNKCTITITGWDGAHVGGVVGFTDYYTSISKPCSITGCYNEGAITTEGDDSIVGGVVGSASAYSNTYPTSVTDCYNKGAVTANGSSSDVGGVVGNTSYSSSISDCYNLGAVTATSTLSMVGGVVGDASSAVNYCYNEATVTAEGSSSNIGGVVGYASSADQASTASLKGCYNSGVVLAKGSDTSGTCIGGVVGCAYAGRSTSTTSVDDCYNLAAVTAEGSAAYIGGVVGYASEGSFTSETSVSGSYNAGVVTAKGSSSYVGGVVGYAYAGSQSTTLVGGCYNSAAVVAEGSDSRIGGVVGYAFSDLNNFTITLTSCYSYGSVSSASDTYLGGVLGYNQIGSNTGAITITYCYYDNVTLKATDATELINTPKGAVNDSNSSDSTEYCGLTSTNMMSTTTTSGTLLYYLRLSSDYRSYWPTSYDTNINNGYPILLWQEETNE